MSAREVTVWMVRCDGVDCVQWERGSNLELLLAWCKRQGWSAKGDKHYCPGHDHDGGFEIG